MNKNSKKKLSTQERNVLVRTDNDRKLFFISMFNFCQIFVKTNIFLLPFIIYFF